MKNCLVHFTFNPPIKTDCTALRMTKEEFKKSACFPATRRGMSCGIILPLTASKEHKNEKTD